VLPELLPLLEPVCDEASPGVSRATPPHATNDTTVARAITSFAVRIGEHYANTILREITPNGVISRSRPLAQAASSVTSAEVALS
jgi:hypothetical protein